MCYLFQLSDQASRWFSLKGHEIAVSRRRTTRSQKVRSTGGKREARQVNGKTEMGKIDTSICCESLVIWIQDPPGVTRVEKVCFWITTWGRQPAILQKQFRKGKIRTFSSNKEDFFPFKSEETAPWMSLFSALLNAGWNLKKVFKGSILIHWPFSDWEKNSATTKQGKWKLNRPASFVTNGC